MTSCCQPALGSLHPLTLLRQHIAGFFQARGYTPMEGPEIEAEWFNFDVLNMADDHFARAPDNTFYLAQVGAKRPDSLTPPDSPGPRSGLVLRAHTSPVQARTLLTQAPPLYRFHIGRTYRPDALDATHSPVFNQLEGLAVDRHLTMDNLKQLLDELAHALFGQDLVTRLRPYEFAYAQPAAEIDIQCNQCHGQSTTCPTCQGEGWIEWGGCGMVHPNVLINCGVNPDEFRAFSFGIGVERTLMLRDGLQDLQPIVNGDVTYAHSHAAALSHAGVETAFASRGDSLTEWTLASQGLVQVSTFPFTSVQELAPLLPASSQSNAPNYWQLRNPIAGMAPVLRPLLLPGLLNLWQQQSAALPAHSNGIFERARVFLPGLLSAAPAIATGSAPSDEQLAQLYSAIPRQPFHLAALGRDGGQLLTAVQAALAAQGVTVHCREDEPLPWATSGVTALVTDAGDIIGHAGQLAPHVLSAWQLSEPLAACEITMDITLQEEK
ncbi:MULTISPECIES: tRNA ligase subunit PheS family protein [Dickeya]|uniref:phenylalanine--tRNA ligase n=1 Tax=Dickeya aquatica TaxID=1401087 RepID=A0A375AE60_9GAMM|nr:MULTISPECIES: phenylalanine--tRNA ligase subunit alpha [Dickeya]SLM64380.1 Phenylalanyl-tRNA synthetase alpha chain [Dickeya aquatica]